MTTFIIGFAASVLVGGLVGLRFHRVLKDQAIRFTKTGGYYVRLH